MASWENCERRGGSVNVAAEGANIIRREAKGYAGEGERGRGSVKAEGAGAEVFAGDGCSQGASFGPMALISRRGQGRRIYNNTRTREWLRRKCVKPADLTTHSPSKICSRPRTTTRPSRALPLPHATPTHARRLRDAFPAAPQHLPRRRLSLAPAQRHALAEHFRSPTQPRRTPPHSDARPQAARDAFPADRTPHSPPKTFARPAQRHALAEALRSPTQPRRTPTQCRRTPAGCAMHSPPTAHPIPRSATLPLLPFRFGHKKTAPHSACAMPNVSVDRRCGRSFGLVSRALFAAVAGRWRVGVGLRPQPWALRSRRCGRVLRA